MLDSRGSFPHQFPALKSYLSCSRRKILIENKLQGREGRVMLSYTKYRMKIYWQLIIVKKKKLKDSNSGLWTLIKKSLGHCVPIGFSEIIYHFLPNKLVHSYVNDLACTHKDKSSSVKRMVFQDWKKKKTAIFFLDSFWLS